MDVFGLLEDRRLIGLLYKGRGKVINVSDIYDDGRLGLVHSIKTSNSKLVLNVKKNMRIKNKIKLININPRTLQNQTTQNISKGM